MTKYVLNSGGLKNNIPGAKKFVAELVKGLGENPKVLFCCGETRKLGRKVSSLC
jgi:hypothetical protein